MAQSGYTPILIYGSGTTGNSPAAGNLTSSSSGAELALNYFDGKLFYKDASGNVQVLATKDSTSGSFTTLSASSTVTFSATTQNLLLGTSQTSGTWTAGGASQTGTITLDQSTKAHTLNLGTGATENATTKTINLGTAGVSGSTTTINIGSAVSGATNNITINGTPTFSGGTANGVLYLNGSKVATSGSALTFDGTNLTSTVGAFRSTVSTVDSIFGSGSFVSGTLGIGTVSNHPITFNVNLNELMRLTSTGLGIGTSSPGAKLDVAGSARASGTLTASYSPSYDQTYISQNGAAGAGCVMATVNYANSAYQPITYDASYYAWRPNGTEGMRLDSSGNLLVGTTSTGADGLGISNLLNLTFPEGSGTSYANVFRQTSSAATVIANGYKRSATASGFASSIGTSWAKTAIGLGVSTGAITFYTDAAATVANGTDVTPTPRATIDSSGNLLIGRTASVASEFLCVEGSVNAAFLARMRATNAASPFGLFVSYTAAAPNGTSNQFIRCDDNAATRAEIRSNGGIANYQANDVNLSDRREKTDFAPAKDYLDTICAIPVQTFKYIDQTDDEKTLGVVAQDVQAVAPELVHESNWGTEDEPRVRLSVYQTDLQYALMKAIQELTARVAQLEAKG